jgi:isocitrate dehydrogenase
MNTMQNFRIRGGAKAMRVSAPRRFVVMAAGKTPKITLLPGDGIGPEIMNVAVKVSSTGVNGFADSKKTH